MRADLPLLARATYMCELVDRLIEEREPNRDVFDLLLSAFYLLKRHCDYPDVIVHAFELRLLAERGYSPELFTCVRCGEAMIDRKPAGFSPSLGGILCGADRFTTEDAVNINPYTVQLMRILSEAEPEVLVGMKPEQDKLQEIARCLRWYIRYRCDRDLKSAEFLDMIRMTG